MKRILVFVLLFLLAFASAAQSVTVNGVFDYGKAKDLVSRLNKVRKGNQLPLLTMERDLTEAAMLRAAELSTQWDFNKGGVQVPMHIHQRPNEAPFYTIVEEMYAPKKFDSEVFGEIFVCGAASDVWAAEQRKAIIKDQKTRGKWTHVGVGVCYESGRIFWVVLYTRTGNGKTDVPDGLWSAQVRVDTVSGGSTKVLLKEAADSTQSRKSTEVQGKFLYDMAAEITVLVNKDRQAENLPALIRDSVLTVCAMLRAAELSTGTSVISTMTQKYGADVWDGRTTQETIFDYSHTRPNLKFCTAILDDGSRHSENLAYNFHDAQTVETAWMNSPGHRANILRSSWKLIGVGVFENNSGIYLIQYFSNGRLSKRCQSKIHEMVTVQVSLDPKVPTKVLKKKRIQ